MQSMPIISASPFRLLKTSMLFTLFPSYGHEYAYLIVADAGDGTPSASSV
jgi:hypothetical protein